MSSIKTCERLLKRACLTNLIMPDGISITPILSGSHGLGKSAICKKIAKDIGGVALTIEGGSLKEGEITGLPFSQTNSDGTKEVRFIPYYQTGRIQQLERVIYEKAKTDGFLGGTCKLNEDGSVSYKDSEGKKQTIEAKSSLQKIADGEDNKYAFGDNLPTDVKFKLIKSGEVMPVVLFIDEMNRTDSQTMKEFMNIVLTRSVNGYHFPWWTFIVSAINPCGQDSVYSTNDLDAAQLDRFLKIKVDADLTEWVEYALDAGINNDYIIALSTNEEIFATTGKGYSDEADDLSPSPRSHEICSYIYGGREIIDRSGFFTPEELKFNEEDVRALITGKIGMRAGRTMLSALKNKENFIDPADLITGKSKTIDEKYLSKINNMKTMAKRVLIRNIVKYMAKTGVKHYYDQADTKNATAEKSTELKGTWSNIISQIKVILGCIDPATQLMFAKDVLSAHVELSDPKYQKYQKNTLFNALACTFSTDILQQVAMTSDVTNSGAIDKK